jgi:hypothetical protein
VRTSHTTEGSTRAGSLPTTVLATAALQGSRNCQGQLVEVLLGDQIQAWPLCHGHGISPSLTRKMEE